MSKQDSPIFIHSMFRSGSTYIFERFRRSEDPPYFCFQEPLNEAVYLNRNTRAQLQAIGSTGDLSRLLRHPEMDRPYFAELCDIYPAWVDTVRFDQSYDRAFDTTASEASLGFFRSIIAAAAARPVIQECRTVYRAGMYKKSLGGVCIHLWRNPWDQWWSYKSTSYFDTVNQLLISAEPRPQVVNTLRERIDFQEAPPGELTGRYHHFEQNRPTAEASYLTFYTLWLLSQLSLRPVQDLEINIDQLAQSETYRAATQKALEAAGIAGLDFSGCATPVAGFGETDAAFFAPLEKEVRTWFIRAGYTASELSRIDKVRDANAPKRPALEAAPGIARDAERARSLARDLEDRSHHLVRAAQTKAAHLIAGLQAEVAARVNEMSGIHAELTRLRGEREILGDRVTKADQGLAERDAEITRLHIAVLERTKSFEDTLSAQAKAFEGVVESVRANTSVAYESRIAALQDEAAQLAAATEARLVEMRNETAHLLADAEAASAARVSALTAEAAQSLADSSAAYEARIAALQDEAVQLAAATEARLTEMRHDTARLLADAEAASAASVAALTTEAAQALADAKASFEAQVTVLDAEASKVEAEFETRLEAMEQRQADLQRDLTKAQQSTAHWQSAAHALRHEIGDLEQRLAASSNDAAQWFGEMQARQAQINAMRASTSWKISAPVRWTKQGVRGGLAVGKNGLRPVLDGALRLVRGNPWLKPPILAAARLLPPVQRKLSAFVSVRPPPPAENEVTRAEPWHLTPDDGLVSEWAQLLDDASAAGGKGA